jgi:large subunit ribosomal protein L10
MAHVAQYKKEIIKKVVDDMKKSSYVGIVDMENLPAKQLQKMRKKLKGKVDLFMTKKRLIRIALDMVKEEKKGIEKLGDYLRGMPALVYTQDNPFTLFKVLKQNKSSAPAKGGQTAPKDIVVKAGKTSFSPGPIIGELGAFRIKTGVEGGKVSVVSDTVVCKEGEVISDKLAGILTRLDVQPMEVGLALTAIYEDGIIFTKDVLDIDEEQFMSNLIVAASDAFKLSVEIGHVTKDNIEFILGKSFREAKHLAVETGIASSDTINDLITKGCNQANALKVKAKL